MAPRLQTEIDREALRRRLTAMNAEASPPVSTPPPAAPANETPFFERPRVQQVISSLPTLIASVAGLNMDRAIPVSGALSQYQQRQAQQQQAQWQREMQERQMALQEAQFAAQNQPPSLLPVGPDILSYYGLPEGFQTTAEGLGALTQGYATAQLGRERSVGAAAAEDELQGQYVPLSTAQALDPNTDWSQFVEQEGPYAGQVNISRVQGWRQGEADIAGTEAGTALREAQTEAINWENHLNQMFGEQERQASLDQQIAEAAREQLGLEMDQEQLDRFRRLTDPIVSKAVTEAELAKTALAQNNLDLFISQETVDEQIAMYEQELENLRIQGQISQEEYEQAVALGPIRIQQAREALTSQQLENQQQELANQFAASTLQSRIAEAQNQAALTGFQLQQAEVQLADARRRLAMARRLDPVQEQQAQLEVQLLEAQVEQLRLQNASAQNEAATFGGIDPNDPNFLFKMYQAESDQFEKLGMWVPGYQEYLDVLSSGGSWPDYVRQYDAQQRAQSGPAPRDIFMYPPPNFNTDDNQSGATGGQGGTQIPGDVANTVAENLISQYGGREQALNILRSTTPEIRQLFSGVHGVTVEQVIEMLERGGQ